MLRFAVGLLALTLLGGAVPARAADPPVALARIPSDVPIFPLADLRPGMKRAEKMTLLPWFFSLSLTASSLSACIILAIHFHSKTR